MQDAFRRINRRAPRFKRRAKSCPAVFHYLNVRVTVAKPSHVSGNRRRDRRSSNANHVPSASGSPPRLYFYRISSLNRGLPTKGRALPSQSFDRSRIMIPDDRYANAGQSSTESLGHSRGRRLSSALRGNPGTVLFVSRSSLGIPVGFNPITA